MKIWKKQATIHEGNRKAKENMQWYDCMEKEGKLRRYWELEKREWEMSNMSHNLRLRREGKITIQETNKGRLIRVD